MTVLVLSGGGLWSVASLGVVEALRDMGIAIDGYVGTSSGAVVAALLAMGHSPQYLAHVAVKMRSRGLKGIAKKWAGDLMRGRLPTAMTTTMDIPLLRRGDWNDVQHPLWIVTTSLTQRRPVIFGTANPVCEAQGHAGDLSFGGRALSLQEALTASMAVPGWLDPLLVHDDVLVDGGVSDDYPVDVAAWVGADRIIGVWIDEKAGWVLPYRWHAGHLVAGAITTMIRELSVVRQRRVEVPRVDLRIAIEGGHRVWNRLDELVQEGYREAMSHRRQIQELMRGGFS